MLFQRKIIFGLILAVALAFSQLIEAQEFVAFPKTREVLDLLYDSAAETVRRQNADESDVLYAQYLANNLQSNLIIFVAHKSVAGTNLPNGVTEGETFDAMEMAKALSAGLEISVGSGNLTQMLPGAARDSKLAIEFECISDDSNWLISPDAYSAAAVVSTSRNFSMKLRYISPKTKPDQIFEERAQGTFVFSITQVF
jgi:hypothetical protein